MPSSGQSCGPKFTLICGPLVLAARAFMIRARHPPGPPPSGGSRPPYGGCHGCRRRAPPAPATRPARAARGGYASGAASARIITQSNSITRPVVASRVTGYMPLMPKPSAS